MSRQRRKPRIAHCTVLACCSQYALAVFDSHAFAGMPGQLLRFSVAVEVAGHGKNYLISRA